MLKRDLLLLLAACISNIAYGITVHNLTECRISVSTEGRFMAEVASGDMYDFKEDRVRVIIDNVYYTVGVDGSDLLWCAEISKNAEGRVQVTYMPIPQEERPEYSSSSSSDSDSKGIPPAPVDYPPAQETSSSTAESNDY